MAEEIPEIDPSVLQKFEKIGSGCTADVYRGAFGRIAVAIKEIDWDKTRMDAKQQLAFDREVAIMPKVDHPNLVKFYGVCVPPARRPFQIVSEYCSGGCCFELLHNADEVELVWSQQVKMCLDVASAMTYLHEFTPQIIHRDLKSLNLLLANPIVSSADEPLVKVSDFGSSRMKDRAPDAEWGKMTKAAGTCHWMAPEVFRGTSYNEKVDIYSYAMILFEIICREIPFEEEEPAGVGRLVLSGHRPDMEAVPPDCPTALRDLMVRCWVEEPSHRPDFSSILRLLVDIQAQV